LVVYILREISKLYPQAWIRVWDADGEFLLVEAANVTPKWLSPTMDQNRSWIHNGRLYIIPPDKSASYIPGPLTLSDALTNIKANPDSLFHSPRVEKEAFYRLEKYPRYITLSLHHARVRIPRKLAYLLHEQPKAVAPAVEKFYLRDAVGLKSIMLDSSSLHFPPEDFVTVSVRFTRVLYAQLYSQRFEPPPRWKAVLERAIGKSPAARVTAADSKLRLQAEIGMKLTCGFELMVNKASKSNSRVVREVSLLLQDVEEDGPESLPTDEEIKSWKDVDRDDDDSWMDVDFGELEKELGGSRGADQGSTSKRGFGDLNAQDDLRKIVSRFEDFLNDEAAGVEGAEFDEEESSSEEDGEGEIVSEEEDRDVSLDEKEFTRLMKEVMGLSSEAVKGKSVQPQPTEAGGDNFDMEEIQKLTEGMEAELKEHGALSLDLAPKKRAVLKGKKDSDDREGSVEESGDDEEINVDYNLAKNILESFKGQAGTAGPVSNILGMMGIQLPRDEEDDSTSDGEGYPTNQGKHQSGS